jgi:quinol monooxygenase YgiN
MLFIVVKFPVRPESSESWLELVQDFTQATRQEPGNLFFEWSRSVDDPTQFVLVEGFRDAAAGKAHVESEHFQKAMDTLSYAVSAKPQIVSTEITDSSGWSLMGELTPRSK